MRSADLFRQQATNGQIEEWKEVNGSVDLGVVIVADNVARQVYAEGFPMQGIMLERDFPCLRAPWPLCTIEYPNQGTERRLVQVWDLSESLSTLHQVANRATSPDATPIDMAVGGAFLDSGRDPRSAACTMLVTFGHKDTTFVLWSLWAFVLDERGAILGNRWLACSEHMNSDLAMLGPNLVALRTLSLLHCKNVTLDEHMPDAKVQAKRQRNGRLPLLKYQTLRLDVPRRQGGGGSSARIGVLGAHIVAGHFAHYGDCCPSVHPPNGKLFGKLEGVYWMPMHARGNRDLGVTVTDWNIQPKRRSSR